MQLRDGRLNQFLPHLLPLLAKPVRDDVAPRLEGLALRLRNSGVLTDALGQLGRPQHGVLVFTDLLVGALVYSVVAAVGQVELVVLLVLFFSKARAAARVESDHAIVVGKEVEAEVFAGVFILLVVEGLGCLLLQHEVDRPQLQG